MPAVCFYFQVHQPVRLRRFSIFDRGHDYFDERVNREIITKVAGHCYLPANAVLHELMRRLEGRFRVAFSLSGVVIDQLERYAPQVLESFQTLVRTGAVELLAETSHHSLAFLYSREEFESQVRLHAAAVKRCFDVEPRVFRNTELVYNNEVARAALQLGYSTVLCEGADHVLAGRPPGRVYHPPGLPQVRLLLKNYRLSDDVAFRFGDRGWSEWPLTADKYARWIEQLDADCDVVNLFMDYETFGEHQWAETGIFEFLRHLPVEVLKSGKNEFVWPSEAAARFTPRDVYDAAHMTSWADAERDLSAWLGNAMQSNALHELYRLEPQVRERGDESLLQDWRRLQTSDHVYYMSTKSYTDAAVHKYFSPYDTPYDAFINYMNVLDNLRERLSARPLRSRERTTTRQPHPSSA